MRDTINKLSYLFSRREKRNGVILFVMMIVGAFAEVVGVGAIPAFVGVLSMPERLLENDMVRFVYDLLGLQSPQEMVLWAALALIAVFVVKNAYLGLLVYLRSRYTTNRQVTVANRLFRAYLHSPYAFHLQRNTAELLRNTNIEANAVTGGVLLPMMTILMEFMVLTLIFVLLFVVEPFVTLLTFCVFGIMTFAFYRATRSKITEYAKEEQQHRKQSMQAVNQGLGGFKDARILGREQFFLNSFQESTWFRAKAARFKAVIQAMPRLFLETMAVAGLLGVASLLVAQDRDLDTIVPTLTLLGVAVVRLMPSFTKISGSVTALKWGTRALDVVYDDVMELETEERALKELRRAGRHKALAFEQEIRIENLSYAYPGSAEKALDRLSLPIPKNTSVGFVGPSGAGKTTIVDVILGLLTPTEGQVLVDGVDIQERLPAWQRKIGYIPQSIYLTDDTVRGNVAFGMGENEVDDAKVWKALEAAQLRDLVESLPEGLDTFVGERGVRLSGGQRQRIGIARALFHNPEVLVMDEATSALDNQTERHIVEALEQLQGEHTLVVIAHRLSTVRNCDTLFMLDEGRLVASGSYDELIATSDEFRRMAGVESASAASGVAL